MIGTAARGAGIRVAALLVALGAIASPLSGCGSKRHNPLELKLERIDLALLGRRLIAAESPIKQEMKSAKEAWPSLYGGLRSGISRSLEASVRTADMHASSLGAPPYLEEVRKLTGPGSGVDGLYKTFWSLDRDGWSTVEATIDSIRRGPKASASFRRANVGIYIQAIYDAHYDISIVGKDLKLGYERLGGEKLFGKSLTATQVEAIARFYSPAQVGLQQDPAKYLRH